MACVGARSLCGQLVHRAADRFGARHLDGPAGQHGGQGVPQVAPGQDWMSRAGRAEEPREAIWLTTKLSGPAPGGEEPREKQRPGGGPLVCSLYSSRGCWGILEKRS